MWSLYCSGDKSLGAGNGSKETAAGTGDAVGVLDDVAIVGVAVGGEAGGGGGLGLEQLMAKMKNGTVAHMMKRCAMAVLVGRSKVTCVPNAA